MDNEKKKITHKPVPTTLREYIAHLRTFTRKYGDLPIVYEDGEYAHSIHYYPMGLGHVDGSGLSRR